MIEPANHRHVCGAILASNLTGEQVIRHLCHMELMQSPILNYTNLSSGVSLRLGILKSQTCQWRVSTCQDRTQIRENQIDSTAPQLAQCCLKEECAG